MSAARRLLLFAVVELVAACAAPTSPATKVGSTGARAAGFLPLASAEPDAAPAPTAVAALDVPKEPAWPPPAPGIKTPFCLDGVVDALAEDACYVLPAAPTRTLLIYLPGLMSQAADSSEKRIVESVVAASVKRAGIAALVPRGMVRRELIAPEVDDKGRAAYLSWPTGDAQYRKHAKALVAGILAKRRALEALVGAPFERVFLGGSSAGAYFVAHLMLRGDFPADGYLVISGGSARPAPHFAELPKRPVYVGYGDGDVVGPKASEVAAVAQRAGWPVRLAVHHAGHGSREAYLDEAFALFGVTGAGANQ